MPVETTSLAPEQVVFALRQVDRWLRIRAEFEKAKKLKYIVDSRGDASADEFASRILLQIAIDAAHSALLHRLLSGKEPLPVPPPLKHAYPVYPD